MAKTYLDLCNWVLPRIGYSGQMNTVTGTSRDHALVAQAVADADVEIQSIHQDWKFLQSQETVSLAAGDGVIDPIPEAASYRVHPWEMRQADGTRFRVAVGFGDPPWSDITGETGQPGKIWIQPDNRMVVVPMADGDYELDVEYNRKPVRMTEGDDEPLIPEQFRMVIAHRALQHLCQIEEAMALEQFSHRAYLEWVMRLQNDQMPGHQPLGLGENLMTEVVRAQ